MKYELVQAFVWDTCQKAIDDLRATRAYWSCVPCYAYYRASDGAKPGICTFFAEGEAIPDGFILVRSEHVGYGETVPDIRQWLIKALWRLPICPVD